MFIKKISAFLVSTVILLGLASCGDEASGTSITDTSNSYDTITNMNNVTSSDTTVSITTSVDSSVSLVSGENLAKKMSFKAQYDDIEDNIEAVVEYASTATLCVENYQSVRRTQFNGFGWTTTTTHTLYGWGSGVIYYKALLSDGRYLYKLITNEHVVAQDSYCIKGEEEFQIYDEHYDANISATLLGTNAEVDIAVLQFVSEREYNAVALEDSSNIKVGSYVIAMGTPIELSYYNTATFGIVSKIGAQSIQHDATINSGNSGGPLFSLNGNLVGINNAKLSGYTSSGTVIEGIYFAISNDAVSSAVNAITSQSELIC